MFCKQVVVVTFVKSVIYFCIQQRSNQIRSEVKTHDHGFDYTQKCGTCNPPTPNKEEGLFIMITPQWWTCLTSVLFKKIIHCKICCLILILDFRLDQELDFIMAQQQELEEMLKPLEEAVNSSNLGSRQLQQADKERDST